MRISPLQQVKNLYGSKDKLIAAVADHFSPADGESADDFRARLRHVANAKLLRLAKIGESIKALGGREAMIAKIAELRGQAKDKDYLGKLATYASPRLLDLHRSLSRKASRAATSV